MAILRQDRMTNEERMIALLKRQPLDRIPVYGIIGGFAALNVGYTISDLYTDITGQKSRDSFKCTTEQYGLQDLPWTGSAIIGAWEFGGQIGPPIGEFAQAPIVTRFPVTTEEEAWNVGLPPDIKQAGIIPLAMENSKALDRSGDALILGLGLGPWEVACSICSMERLGRWAIKKPELTHRLLRLTTDFMGQITQYWVDTFGPERLLFFTAHPQTSNQLISPKIFDEFCLPYIQEHHEKILATGCKHIICHVCGEQNLNLSSWAKIPMGDPGIVSFGHEVDLEIASKHFPHDVIMGNIEPAVIQTGTPEQVYELARICIEKGRKHLGGFMLAPGCEMPPKAPPYNVWTMMKAVSDFGWYD